MSATVYFSPVITPEKVLDMFKLVDKTLPGNIAIKLHSGETLPMAAPATPPRSTAS